MNIVSKSVFYFFQMAAQNMQMKADIVVGNERFKPVKQEPGFTVYYRTVGIEIQERIYQGLPNVPQYTEASGQTDVFRTYARVEHFVQGLFDRACAQSKEGTAEGSTSSEEDDATIDVQDVLRLCRHASRHNMDTSSGSVPVRTKLPGTVRLKAKVVNATLFLRKKWKVVKKTFTSCLRSSKVIQLV